ncbi:ATP-binding cassette domain-containing protein [Microbacterium proteolyticum]|uniref:ATP-binding cassette domain-containing protein n=1 Tax=Microbacterium proteolyticum TaxID=1572644 RepID=UPI001FAD9EE0|nr:excinuclease ABC subunit UvrA [Microbacterium proteolyticum]MCI9858345.1 excinuclease ABC subunit UvrA [Microbacterium proteolyticum]
MSVVSATLGDDPEEAPVTDPDAHDVIRVRGARENNLKNVDLDVPKRRLTVFTGVSGSGKSSLVFGTIAAESQRLINETYPTFVQQFMGELSRPDVDALENLSATIRVDQERMGANARSTVGTATDVHAMLRVLFSRLGQPHVGSSQAFSFNVPSISGAGAVTLATGAKKGQKQRRSFEITGGMCPECEGLGQVSDIDLDRLVDKSLSVNAGAILVPGYTPDGWMVRIYGESGFLDPDKPVQDFTEQERQDFFYKEQTKVRIANTNMTYEGLVPKVTKSMLQKDRDALQPHVRAFVDRAVTFISCPACEGTRLNEGARSSRIGDVNIADAAAMQITDLAAWVRIVDDPTVAPLIQGLRDTLDAFVHIGLGYLSLDRASGTLSGGEAQRTKMIRHLGSSLSDITYVFDEPTAGLHPHDIQRMNETLLQLRDKGNTVLVVEHKPEVIEIADHVVDLGPRAGRDGGTVQYEGDVPGLRSSDTLTGRFLDHRAELKTAVRSAAGAMPIRGASQHNLRDVDVDVPRGVLTVVTGVAGSGKSSLIHGNLPAFDDVVVVDQTAIKGSRRSSPATYTGILDAVRTAFGKANGVKPALFSANSEGACPACKGLGVIVTQLGFQSTVETVCELCEGTGFSDDVLEYTLDGKNIAEVLAMSVTEAGEFLVKGPAVAVLGRLRDVGLGYLTLGQSLNTLSGGERQRLKLAISMAKSGAVYVLDEPTTGLHLADVDTLLRLLDQLVDAGNTVVVIEHHQAVMAHADWIIDLGPGAGRDGGVVVFEGTPADLVAARSTLTAEHLARYVGA